MNVYATDGFPLPLPPGHRFPAAKYTMLRARLLAQGVVSAGEITAPEAAPDDVLTLAHTPDYVARVRTGRLTPAAQRRIGLPWSPPLVERARRSVGATLSACTAARRDGIAVSLAGGTHHAYADHGEGYCVFNDAVVATRWLRAATPVRRVLIVDCDVHHGNGTAALGAGDDALFVLDVYAERNYPFRKERVSHAVVLPDGTGDDQYLQALRVALPAALAAARPELAIYLAGADPLAGDRLGRLALTKVGLEERDRFVLDTLWVAGVPTAVTLAGGYARDLADTVDIHAATVRIAATRLARQA